jgi:NTE family protein
MRTRPDVLVLGGGGVLGEAWMTGLLAGIEDATGIDLRQCEHFVGTSAGSIVAAQLTAGASLRRPPALGAEPAPAESDPTHGLTSAALEAARRAGAIPLAFSALLAPLALGLAEPAGARVRAGMLRRLPRPRSTLTELRRRIEASAAPFDGRLRVTAVERASGRRIVFGSPGAPRATVGEAVEASCSVPWLFAPVTIGGREYVDGGVWSPTNLDTAPAGRDTQVLCLNPIASITATSGALGVMRRIARSAVSVETLSLKRRGASVQTIAPDARSAEAMGPNLMDREPQDRVLAAAYRQGLRTGVTGP